MAEPYKILYDYSSVPTIKKFAQSNKRIRGLMGPFGCLRGDTLVITSEGLVPISEVTHSMLVLSWDDKSNQFVFSLNGSAFPKGKDYLYRISTRHGEFVAAGHHRVLCGDNKYRPVSDLCQGDILTQCSGDHLQIYFSVFQKSFREGGLRSSERLSSFQDRCAKLIRFYGQRLLWEANTDQDVFPSRVGAQTLCTPNGLIFSEHKDDLAEPSRGHIHQDQSYDLIHTGGYPPRIVPHNEGVRDCISSLLFSHNVIPLRQFLLHRLKSTYRRTKKLFSEYFHSYKSSSLSDGNIISIERLNVKEEYWDIKVLNTNNYVTADGTIHHNSGKSSGCLMEIIRRAHEQKASADGIRRSRYAIVRNTFRMLVDTTIRTVFDWLPESVFGEYSVTHHNYLITKMPGVHLELMFRALDRPEHISNLLSMELTGAWINEAREVPWEIIDAIDGRINRYPGKKDGGCSWTGIILDTNPPDENSEWYNYFEKVKPSTAAIFKQPSGLSPQAENLPNLAKDYYKTLAIGKNEQYVRVYIEGKYGYTQEGKPVIEQFNDNVHIALSVIQPMEDRPLVVSYDFGLNPTMLLGQITPRGKLLILEEFVSDGMGLKNHLQNVVMPVLRANYFGMPIQGGYGDPAGSQRTPTDESTCYDVLRDFGLKQIMPCPTNALLPRIAAVEGLLTKMIDGEPALIISPKCVMLRKALNGGYHRQRIAGTTNEFSDQPFKNIYSHPADALQYLCYYVTDAKNKNKRNEEVLKRIGHQHKHKPASSIVGL